MLAAHLPRFPLIARNFYKFAVYRNAVEVEKEFSEVFAQTQIESIEKIKIKRDTFLIIIRSGLPKT